MQGFRSSVGEWWDTTFMSLY